MTPTQSSAVRTRLAALAGPHLPPWASAAAPPPAVGPGAAFPAPEQWPRGKAPGSRRPSAAGRSHQRSARQPSARGSRAPRAPPLPGRSPGTHAAPRRALHEPRATREASMALRPRRGDAGSESSAPWGADELLLPQVPKSSQNLGHVHTCFQTPARSSYTGGLEPPRAAGRLRDAFATSSALGFPAALPAAAGGACR